MIQVFRTNRFHDDLFGDEPALDPFGTGGDGRIVLVALPFDPRPPAFPPRNAMQWMHVVLPRGGESPAFDPRAALLDVLPQVGPGPLHPATPPLRPMLHRERPAEIRDDDEEEVEVARATAGPRTAAAPAAGAARPAAAYRKLFPDPGLRRIVRWGDVREALAPQLAEPQRLRDTHRLLCFVQVYEATAAQRWESLAAAIQEEAGAASRLELLTPESAARLQLLALLRTRPRLPRPHDREPEKLLPRELVFRLQVAHDPTVDVEARRPPQPEPDRATAPPGTPPAAAGPTRRLNAIPDHLVRPWDFHFSREEVLYDMSAAAGDVGLLGALLRGLRSRLGMRRAWRKWQALLSGKSLHEQLWTVRPPEGRLSHPAVHAWARATLERAGYDPYAMLAEWEIFWRRKGA